jgi:serine/threonine protein kinase
MRDVATDDYLNAAVEYALRTAALESGAIAGRTMTQVRDMTQRRLLGGRYELDGIVGRGGMAEVFRARDIRLNRIVGVKTLRNHLARDQMFQARFRREAQSAASLNHPSIVAVYDTGEDMVGGTPVPYIVMEFGRPSRWRFGRRWPNRRPNRRRPAIPLSFSHRSPASAFQRCGRCWS